MNEAKIITSHEEFKEKYFGKIGTPAREDYERKSQAYILGEIIKEERRLAQLTQEELAQKAGTKKNFIAKIEGGSSDVQLTTLFKIVEGLGKHLTLSIS